MEDLLLSQFAGADASPHWQEKAEMTSEDLLALAAVDLKPPPSTPPPPPSHPPEGPLFRGSVTTTNRSTDSTTGSNDNPEWNRRPDLLNQSLVSFLANTLPPPSWQPTKTFEDSPPLDDLFDSPPSATYEDEQLQSLLGMLTLQETAPEDRTARDRSISYPVNSLLPSTPVAAPAWPTTRQCQSMDRANVRRQLLVDAEEAAKLKRAPVKGWWKTELCKFWREGSGCRNGSSCRWAHGDDELRRVSPMDLEKPTERRRHASYQYTPRTNDLSPPGLLLAVADPQQLPRPRAAAALPPLPRHSLSPGDTRGPPAPAASTELGWAQLPLEQLPMDRRIDAVDHVWNVVRVRHAISLRLPENVIVAGMPGLQVNQKYWRDLLCALEAPSPPPMTTTSTTPTPIGMDGACLILTNQCTGTNTTATTSSATHLQFPDDDMTGDEQLFTKSSISSPIRKAISANEQDSSVFSSAGGASVAVLACQLCGKNIGAHDLRILHIGRARLPLHCCDACLQIAEEKAIAIHLPLEYNAAQDERRKLLNWALKLTQFIRTCDEGVWRARDARADVFDLPRQMKTLWDLHVQQLCRLSAVLHLYLESLPTPGRVALFMSEVLPGVSLVEWMAVAHQPMLFLVFLFIGLPLPHLSLPSTVLPVCIPLATGGGSASNRVVTRQSADLTASRQSAAEDLFFHDSGLTDWSPKAAKHVRSGSAAVHRLPPLRAFR